MIAYNPAGTNHDKVRLYDYERHRLDQVGLGRRVCRLQRRLGDRRFGHEQRSDHKPFELAGVDAALVIEYGVWSNPNYHKATDAVETAGYIDYAYATKVTRGVLGYLATAAGLQATSGLLTATVAGQDLILDYAADANGIADIRVRATDTQDLYAEDTFRVTVSAVNDPPSMELINAITELREDADTAIGLKLADILMSDDDQGSNTLSLSGADAALFTVDGSALYLKAGVSLDYETNPVLDVVVEVDDPTVGSAPDDTVTLAVTVLDVDEVPPRVTGFFVRGSNWSAEYLSLLATNNLGTVTGGFRLLDGASQVANAGLITWATIDQISVSFSENVTLGQDSLRLLNSANEDLTFAGTGGFSYDLASNTANWTLAAPLERNRFLIALDAATIADAAGAALTANGPPRQRRTPPAEMVRQAETSISVSTTCRAT